MRKTSKNIEKPNIKKTSKELEKIENTRKNSKSLKKTHEKLEEASE